MSYIASIWNHLRAVQAWARAHQAEARLDMSTLEMEVKAFHRYFQFYPQFIARTDGRTIYAPDLSTPEIVGFAGWLPYRPIQWTLSTQKLDFAAFMVERQLRVPAWWTGDAEPDVPYI